MEHTMQIEKTEAGMEGTLSLRGELTMSYAKESRDVLLEAIQTVDIVHLNLHEVETADVSLVQIICAAHRECLQSGKKIVLDDGAGTIVSNVLNKTGYLKQLGCPDGSKATCLWANT